MAERLEARRLATEGAALLADYLSTHQCAPQKASMCSICAPALMARHAALAERGRPRERTRTEFSLDQFRREMFTL